jgi:pyruvate dehydrogenase E2 component (dihydrolipoamide acetyltransferase)
MTLARRLSLLLVSAFAWVIVAAASATAQSSIDATTTPVENTGGWVYGMAWLITILAGVIVLSMVVAYMRYAPRFAKDEESSRVVHADRVLPGREPPRRTVDLSQAVPIVVQPPSIPAAVAASGAPAAIAAPASAEAAPAASAPAPAAPAPTPAAPAEAAPAAPAPAAAPPSADAASPTASAASGPAAPAPPPARAPAAPAPAAAQRPEVSLDQETFDKTLEELLAKGTDRRVAEGQAKRAAMIAARKKAEGGEG